MKPFAESSEQNKLPILEVLKRHFSNAKSVLEIGSGTGQHAVFFASQLPALQWYTSDLEENHAGILAWIDEAQLTNVHAPIRLDVRQENWGTQKHDALFSANTAHIMDWNGVTHLFRGAGQVLRPGGVFCLYGPFNYDGRYTSESNARFDHWLKSRDPESGIRDFEALCQLAEDNDMLLIGDYPMPANNRILVWEKQFPDGHS
jgi:cyclopropane fatty-acyl-phospholipid synthase-like methyltransferase